MHEAEEKAAEAESRFRTLVERGPAIQYSYVLRSWDPPQVSLDYVSPQLSRLLGVSPDVWTDDPMAWFAMVHPDDRDEMLAASRHTWETGDPWASEYRILAADGNVVWLADRGHCVERDEHGRPTRFLGAITDVTDRRERLAELEAELATLRAITDLAPVVSWTETVDLRAGTSRYTYMSPETEALVGLTPEQLLAEPAHFPRLVHPDDRAGSSIRAVGPRPPASGRTPTGSCGPTGRSYGCTAGGAASRATSPASACGTASRST